MLKEHILDVLAHYFPGSFSGSAQFPQSEVGGIVIDRLMKMDVNLLTCTHLNQLLHMGHELGMTEGFFQYYFSSSPAEHPYCWERLLPEMPHLNGTGLSSLPQLRWGLQRFFTDALLYFGTVRAAYEDLGKKSTSQIEEFFAKSDSTRLRCQLAGRCCHSMRSLRMIAI